MDYFNWFPLEGFLLSYNIMILLMNIDCLDHEFASLLFWLFLFVNLR